METLICAVRLRVCAMSKLFCIQHLLLIKGNPLTADEVAMFEMFDREGWSHERRRAHILAMFQRAAPPEPAE